jgi:AcrR family transcriptional regulator
MNRKVTGETLNTKNRIIEYSRTLFAQKGFDGTSIRELANIADVNVAAINYHFGNKTELYKEVIKQSYCQACRDVENLYNSGTYNLCEFVAKLFDQMYTDTQVVTNFKIVLQDNLLSDISFDTADESIGPPGGATLLKCINQEVGEQVSDEDKLWAVRTIFAQICHVSLISQTSFGKRECLRPYFDTKLVKSNVLRLTDIVLKEIKKPD